MSTETAATTDAVRSPDNYLHIYLADHHAGTRATIELARRMLPNNEEIPLGTYLREQLLPELENDLGTLEDVMARVGTGPQWWKDVAAWAAERVGRLKLNGQLRGYSPLSRVLELEALELAVTAKRMLWATLGEIASYDARLGTFDFSALARRAAEQAVAVTKHHEAAVKAAFGGAENP